DGRSAIACFLVMLVFFKSTSADCQLVHIKLVYCTKSVCKVECSAQWQDMKVYEHWCNRFFVGTCYRKICYD
uniref:Knottin scorpion toxin-like domain-containing protein n=2 Tax=Aegilops tauschii TaxID=37682 RepID=A0A453MDC6_AEGTS